MMEVCQGCGKEWLAPRLVWPIQDVLNLCDQVQPGDPMPTGECPDCGALCYPKEGYKLWFLLIGHKSGENAYVFRTKDEADAELTRFVDKRWDKEIDEEKPEDEDKATRLYFDVTDTYILEEVALSPVISQGGGDEESGH